MYMLNFTVFLQYHTTEKIMTNCFKLKVDIADIDQVNI